MKGEVNKIFEPCPNSKIVLVVPISTIDFESSFSADGQVLDHFRSSLSPTTVEAIICAQNWLKEAPPIAYDTREVMVDAESYKLESGHLIII